VVLLSVWLTGDVPAMLMYPPPVSWRDPLRRRLSRPCLLHLLGDEESVPESCAGLRVQSRDELHVAAFRQ
jgi:hypothetical protein